MSLVNEISSYTSKLFINKLYKENNIKQKKSIDIQSLIKNVETEILSILE